MRIALALSGVLFLGMAALASGGCCGTSGCGQGGPPEFACQSWYWYVPCDMVEGQQYRACGQPAPRWCDCSVATTRTIVAPVMPAPPPRAKQNIDKPVEPPLKIIDGVPPAAGGGR